MSEENDSGREHEEAPEGWQFVQLGEVAEHVLGKMLDKSKNRGKPRPYLRNVNVRWGRVDLTDVKEMRIEDDERERYGLRPGDLLVCEGGEPGRCAIWGRDEPVHFQKALHRVRTSEVLDVRFLARFLEYAAGEGILARLFTGSTIKHLPGLKLGQIVIPLPPRVEQDRIVDAVESAMAAVDEGETSLDGGRRLMPTLRAALLNHLMTREGAPFVSLSDVADIRSGLTKGRKTKGETRDVPFLRAANVQHGFLDLDEIKTIPASEVEEERFKLEAGDVLMVEGSGSPQRLGQGCLWEGQVAGCLHQNHVFRARPDRSRVLPKFLAWAIQAPEARSHFFHQAKTTSGLSTINRTQIGETPIPLPALPAQQEIVSRLEASLGGLAELARDLGNRCDEADALRRSIMHQAFTGQLVPQDPNDEPAAELLERIKLERVEREAELTEPKKRARAAKGGSSAKRSSTAGSSSRGPASASIPQTKAKAAK